ncbi:MAG: T9SS type A sorting domain-containing protein [Bacteroidia bacterium]|jgi:hypothetical protein|nr:T9SS type A sorting domain-containing protein [Bacteroidia bacterium]
MQNFNVMKKLMLLIYLGLITSNLNAAVIHIPLDYMQIQHGINNASNGDTILVQPGVYAEQLNFSGKNIVVASVFLLTNDTSDIASTIIAPNNLSGLDKSVITFENNETSDAQLIGFTIENGQGNYRLLGFDPIFYGGGIYCYDADPVLRFLNIRNNISECGGGIFLYNSNALIENCNISYNTCNSVAMEAPNAGGGIVMWNCDTPVIRNSIMQYNFVATAGGAIYSFNSKADVVNCLITNNHSVVMGGAYYMDSQSHVRIINNTVSGNVCDDGPGLALKSVMYCIDSVNVTIRNSIFYGNNPPAIVCQFNYGINNITMANTNFEGGQDSIYTNNGGSNLLLNWQGGNINTDPQFMNAVGYDFHLQPSSPCINAGDTIGVINIPSTDLDANPRYNGTIDMGCYEFQGPVSIFETITSSNPLLLIYPNPAIEIIRVHTSNNNPKTLIIFDSLGKIVLQKAIEGETTLDVSGLAGGVYLIRIGDIGQRVMILK